MGKQMGFPISKVNQAISHALDIQDEFKSSLLKKSSEIRNLIDKDKPGVVIVSRAYNGYDLGINLNLPKKFRDLGIQARLDIIIHRRTGFIVL